MQMNYELKELYEDLNIVAIVKTQQEKAAEDEKARLAKEKMKYRCGKLYNRKMQARG